MLSHSISTTSVNTSTVIRACQNGTILVFNPKSTSLPIKWLLKVELYNATMKKSTNTIDMRTPTSTGLLHGPIKYAKEDKPQKQYNRNNQGIVKGIVYGR